MKTSQRQRQNMSSSHRGSSGGLSRHRSRGTGTRHCREVGQPLKEALICAPEDFHMSTPRTLVAGRVHSKGLSASPSSRPLVTSGGPFQAFLRKQKDCSGNDQAGTKAQESWKLAGITHCSSRLKDWESSPAPLLIIPADHVWRAEEPHPLLHPNPWSGNRHLLPPRLMLWAHFPVDIFTICMVAAHTEKHHR